MSGTQVRAIRSCSRSAARRGRSSGQRARGSRNVECCSMSGVPLIRLACLAAAVAFVQLPALEPKPDVPVVVSVVAKRALEQPIAGLSIAIARRGVVTETRGFGFADVEAKAPVTPATVFHVASILKNILAGSVLKLVEEGKLSL